MTNENIVVQLPLFDTSKLGSNMPGKQADLHTRWLYPETLPALITACAPAMRVLDLLSPLHWDNLPERNLQRDWGKPTISNASLIIAELVKLNEGLDSFGTLYRHLQEHTAFISLCGFPLSPVPVTGLSFNTRTRLPVQPTSPARYCSSCICRIFCSKVGLLTIGCRLACPCLRKA